MLDDHATGTYHCQVVIVDEGTVAIPVDVELHFADGTLEREHWDHRGGASWVRFEFYRSSRLTEVTIDPDGRVLLADDQLDDRLRITPDDRAARRAAARIGFWSQTAMQGLSL